MPPNRKAVYCVLVPAHSIGPRHGPLLDSIPGIVLILEDNVYREGTYDEFLRCYAPTWGRSSRLNPAQPRESRVSAIDVVRLGQAHAVAGRVPMGSSLPARDA